MNIFVYLYKNSTLRSFAPLVILCLLSLALNFYFGPSKVDPIGLFFEPDPSDRKLQETILWQIRLPRIFLCALVGMAISAAGVLSKAFLETPS